MRSFSLSKPLAEEWDFLKITVGPGDYVLIRPILKAPFDFLAEWAIQICRRRLGVGALGVLLLSENDSATLSYEIQLLDRDGKTALRTDALLCAAKYVFDAGRFGSRPIRFKCGSRDFVLESVDSRNFRIPMERLDQAEAPQAIYRPASGWKALRTAARSEVRGGDSSNLVWYSADTGNRLSAWVSRGASTDFARMALSAAHSARERGLCENEVIVDLCGHPYYIQIEASQTFLTAPVSYVFSGNWSPPDSEPIL